VTREHRPGTGPAQERPEGRFVEVGRPAAADWLLRKLTCFAMRWTNANNHWTEVDREGHRAVDAEFWENAKMAQLAPADQGQAHAGTRCREATLLRVRSAASPAFPGNRLVTERNCLDSAGQNWTRVDMSGRVNGWRRHLWSFALLGCGGPGRRVRKSHVSGFRAHPTN
jgi:hypothetical protein